MVFQLKSRILPNPDGLTLNFSSISEDLKQTLASLGIRHTDYADVNASTHTLSNMVDTRKEMRQELIKKM